MQNIQYVFAHVPFNDIYLTYSEQLHMLDQEDLHLVVIMWHE